MSPSATPTPHTPWRMLTALLSEKYGSLGPRRTWFFTWMAAPQKKRDPLKCTSFASHVTELGIVKGQLDGFYNGNNHFKKHKRDAGRARDADRFGQVFNQDETFLATWIFPVILCSIGGYIMVGVNEYSTSKKCPTYEKFVGQVEIRRLYCSTCKS
ncbi:hypothetical protein BGZ54_002261 [Gamsiella multidivaricata]|nr:hypothetical protein BGZ54_002261 [Gamsiella multidivaricata]